MAGLEDDVSNKRIEEDRSVTIEAAIVRVMKARKTLSHQELIGEVLSRLTFFKPDVQVIKKKIENLIDREYLQRDTEDGNKYIYLA